MLKKKESVIIKFDFSAEQTVGDITKIVGLTMAKYLVPIIDVLDLEANPRSSKTGPVTAAIQESIETDPTVFPFKTKGILLAASQYERLERNRVKITPENPAIEGILDGGHNTLAIGLYILQNAMEYAGTTFPKGPKTWNEFKALWSANRLLVESYLKGSDTDAQSSALRFFIPVELLVPRTPADSACVESFKNDLLEICAARNNNVQLQVSDKANQRGYFDALKEQMDQANPTVSQRIAWKTNDGGEIKTQDIIALVWIPLSLISPVKDHNGRVIEPVLAQNIYRIAVELPALYDYIYEMFPKLYNAAGGSYGHITAVRSLNEKRKQITTPFSAREIETLSPDGYIVPLVYGLQALMEKRVVNGHYEIHWRQPPMPFLQQNLEKIVANYAGLFSMCDYDPQKLGKNAQSYTQALGAFKMALAGIL